MNCGEWEERIALYAGGDLNAAETAAVERHAAECSGCQLLLSGLRESLRLLRGAHAEPVEEAHFSAVRARVLAELERGSHRGWRRARVYALLAAAAAMMVAVWPRPASLVLPVPPAPVAPVAQAPEVRPAAPAAAPARHRTPPRKVAANVNEKPAEPLVVKLITDDPNVVIYWITDTKGE